MAFLLALALWSGCATSGVAPTATPVAVTTPAPPARSLVDLGEIKRLLNEVGQRAEGPVRFLEFTVTEGHFEIQVQDPKKPENADSYQFRSGGKLEKIPLRTNGATAQQLTEASIPLEKLKLDSLPTLLAAAESKAKGLEGRRPATMLVHRAPNGTPEWDVFVTGSRRTVDVSASLDGKINSIAVR